jgi:hypothetical protein
VAIILVATPFSQIKDPDIIPRYGKGCRDVALSRGYDGMATPLGTLGQGLVVCLFMLCIVGFCFLFCYEWFTLFKSLSMHLYILSCMVYWIWIRFYYILSCMTFITILFRAHTLNFKLGGGLTTCLMT